MKLSLLSSIALALTLIFSSCGNGAEQNSSTTDSVANDSKETKAGINLTTFSSIPDSLSGCSCTFSESESQFDANSFLYFDDMSTVCLISIDNKLIVLKPEKVRTEVLNVLDVLEYSNGEYTATIINKKKIGNGEESTIMSGELVIKRKDGATITKKVYGVCGC